MSIGNHDRRKQKGKETFVILTLEVMLALTPFFVAINTVLLALA